MFFFAFSTIIGWYFFVKANIKYLFGPKAVKTILQLQSGFAVCSLITCKEVDLVWNMADCFNSFDGSTKYSCIIFALSKVISQCMKITLKL